METLRAVYPVAKWPAILAALPGRSQAAIRCQVVALDIRRERNSRHPWTGTQIATLRKQWPKGAWEIMAAALPPHTRESIARKASELGLKRDRATKKSQFRIVRELREERRRLGISSEHLAGRIGIHRVQLAKWERGEQVPRLRSFFDWIEALGYRLDISRSTSAR